jgi:succinate-semialdehyde dehydrogenase/glutarate-semialdehyde dehydrogenase
MYIGGRHVAGTASREVVNPADGTIVGRYSMGDRPSTRKAIVAAHDAFAAWSALAARSRAAQLLLIASAIRENADQLARIITLENGKPLKESRGEVGAAAAHFEWFAEEVCHNTGRIVPPTDPSKRHLVIRRPVGVCACITPWNFPFVLWARKVAPALAAGCTVVSRPASQTTLIALAAAELIDDIGLPPGVLNVVTGPAEEVASELIENDLCRKISFTGSTDVGKDLLRRGAARIKHFSLELGGQCPAIVCEDADMDVAVRGVLGAKFRNGGQSCIAANRIYVDSRVYETFLKKFAEAVGEIRVGNGLDEQTDLGPLIDAEAVDKFLAHVGDAVGRGAGLVCGGDRITDGDLGKGSFVRPTILSGVKDDMLCTCEETFGPLAPVSSYGTLDEVIERANNTPYGLAAYVYTTSLRTGFRLAESLEAGTVGVNDDVPSTTIAPFGGMKQSGLGRECGSEGLEAFQETKHVSIVL